MPPRPILPPVRAVFRAVVETVVPRAGAFGDAEWSRGEALVEEMLADRPASVRRQLSAFLRLVEFLAMLRTGRRFSRLAPPGRLRFLRSLERSRLLLLRRGVWGVRTLGFLAVYGQDPVRAHIGYRPDPRGWEARPGAATAATHGEGGG
ncbi:MAG TPA: hypothetical protein VLA43_04780 [Longimicrobiales bacterium]|nr:hypothetical protein [Longimicrobiales bacterium]